MEIREGTQFLVRTKGDKMVLSAELQPNLTRGKAFWCVLDRTQVFLRSCLPFINSPPNTWLGHKYENPKGLCRKRVSVVKTCSAGSACRSLGKCNFTFVCTPWWSGSSLQQSSADIMGFFRGFFCVAFGLVRIPTHVWTFFSPLLNIVVPWNPFLVFIFIHMLEST